MAQKSKKEIINFIYLFSVCVVGSIAIFLFAVGIETGNAAANQILLILLENVLFLVILFLICAWLLWKVLAKNGNR